ncbi:MAG: hypothetical protein AVDCRST_MAG70-457 [uncultured Thermomicrobiales bacterium]|uniref:Uncharacterized protein n=1 Tax=uncultured Thermomicrobiales bacterium TaxID=1645740 RepID=A0A6J4UD89_9BACT|nr:MAG: hypothetical protein AVDCRST_MAG70-457 [uncultured Thermomicrobiales bacterium]
MAEGTEMTGIQDGGHDEAGGDSGEMTERVGLAREIGQGLGDIFVEYVRGGVAFDELTFLTFEAIESLHAVASGEYELEEFDEDDEDGGYEIEEATAEQEDLAQEPARGGE